MSCRDSMTQGGYEAQHRLFVVISLTRLMTNATINSEIKKESGLVL